MRYAVAALTVLCLTGCGGYAMVQSQTDALPPHAESLTPREGSRAPARDVADIARAEASQRHFSGLRVERVECDTDRCRVELSGYEQHGRSAWIKVHVDRETGAVLSYKARIEPGDVDYYD